MAKGQAKKGRAHERPRDPREEVLAELSLRLGVKTRRLEVAVQAAERFEEPEFSVLEKLVSVSHTTPRSLEARRHLCAALRQELERFWTTEVNSDPLADVDKALDTEDAVAASLWADLETRTNRARLLADCISSSEAGELTHRSRQAVERQRKEGNLLALRVGREWRYPKWQFEMDGPRGLLPGLGTVIRSLRLSPFGAALWLTTPNAQLGNRKPVELLRRRQSDRVVCLAEESGYLL